MFGQVQGVHIEKDGSWSSDESRRRLVNSDYFGNAQQWRYLGEENVNGLRPDLTTYGQHIYHRKLALAAKLRSSFHYMATKENMRASLYSPMQDFETNKVQRHADAESVRPRQFVPQLKVFFVPVHSTLHA